MANRSYLYSTNFIPPFPENRSKHPVIGLSEFSIDIPFVHRILLSGKPQTCMSLIWDAPDPIALVGDYDAGIENLKRFISKVNYKPAQEMFEHTLSFLSEPNKQPYFLLEACEIFEFLDDDIPVSCQKLCQQLQDVTHEIDEMADYINHIGSIPANPVKNILEYISAIGFESWSNILYFDFR